MGILKLMSMIPITVKYNINNRLNTGEKRIRELEEIRKNNQVKYRKKLLKDGKYKKGTSDI